MLKTPRPLGQLFTVIGVALAVVLVSGLSVAAYATYDFATSFTKDAVVLEGQDAVPPDIGAIEGGVNLLAGLQHRSGTSFEFKVGLGDSPSFKVGVGYTFK